MKETKFKQTEVGLIPSDWEVKPFKNVATLINGRAYSQNELLERGKYRVLRVGNFGTNDSWYYSNLELPEKMYCDKGDLLYCWSCTYGAYIWDEEKTIYHYHIWKIADLKAEKRYLQYILNNDVVQQMNSSNGSTMSHITKGFLENRLFAFPPTIEEQQRIANALSDVDTLIANLEKLIAKKKNIKQGAIQQLLTGKKRLPGFGSDERTGSRPTDERRKEYHSERSAKREVEESSGYKVTELGLIPNDWEVKTISQVGKIIGGGTPSTFNSAYWNGSVQWFTPAELSKAGKYVSKSERTITKLGVENCSAKILPAGTILLTTRASIGTSAILKAPACTNQGFQSLVVNSENSNEFLYYLLSTKVDEMMSLASGSTFLEISPKKLGGIQLQIPSSRAEQTAIANVLSDMDAEISALETKLAKYRTLKTGMMQQLLTGKIRLV